MKSENSDHLKELKEQLNKFKELLDSPSKNSKEKEMLDRSRKIFEICSNCQKNTIQIFKNALQDKDFVENGYIALLRGAICVEQSYLQESDVKMKIDFLLELMENRDYAKVMIQTIHPALGNMISLIMKSESVNFLAQLLDTLESRKVRLGVDYVQESINFYESLKDISEPNSEKLRSAQRMFEEISKKVYVTSTDSLPEDVLEKSCAIIAPLSNYTMYEIRRVTQKEENLVNAIMKYSGFKAHPETYYDKLQNRLIGKKFVELHNSNVNSVNLLNAAFETENPEIIKIFLSSKAILPLIKEDKTKFAQVALKTNDVNVMIALFKICSQQKSLDGLEGFSNNQQFARATYNRQSELSTEAIEFCQAKVWNNFRPHQIAKWQGKRFEDPKEDAVGEAKCLTADVTPIRKTFSKVPSPLGPKKSSQR
jgi:hypothetical protein